jgi:hypothetical protein
MKKEIDIHDPSYHPDAKLEGVQANNMPDGKIGVRTDTKSMKSPFNVTSLSEDAELKEFKNIMSTNGDKN